MKRIPSVLGASARSRRPKKRVWPPPPPSPILEQHEVWIETTANPTPTAFTVGESRIDALARDDDAPSSRRPVVTDAPAPAAAVVGAVGAVGARRRARAQHWVAVIATFIGLVALVGEREDLSRVVRRLQLPTRTQVPVPLAAAALSEPAQAPCPEGMALVERGAVRVCVDRFEASLVEIGDDGLEHRFSPYVSVEGHVVKALSTPNAVPQAYVSRDEADAACQEAGKRLCSADEWRTACSGPDASLYPYGDAEDDAACNTHGKAPLGELFPRYGSEIYDFRVMNDPSLNALDGTVGKTGSHPRCTNGFGLYDMVGNLHEWTAETTAGKGEFHGGYYLDTHQNGDGCRYVTSAHDRSYHDYSTGFRCCADPE